MVINFNIEAMFAQDQSRLHNMALQRATERLSSGLRINRAADDPSGFAISSLAKAQISGTATAMHNVQESIALYNLRDAYFEEIGNMMKRMRDLAVRASNDATLTSRDMQKLDEEVQGLKNEINRMTHASYKVDGGRLLFNPGDLDVIWVMDVTNSMLPYATSLYNDSVAMFDQFMANGFDLQMGVVGFANAVYNLGDTKTLHSDAAGFQSDVNILRNMIGFEMTGIENGINAIEYALNSGTLGGAFRPDARHVVVLLTDEDCDDLGYTDYLVDNPFWPPPDPTLDPGGGAIRQGCIDLLISKDAKLHAVGVVKAGSMFPPADWIMQNNPDMDYQAVATAAGVDGGVYTLDTGGAWVTSITSTMLSEGGPWSPNFQVGPDAIHSLTERFNSIGTAFLTIDGANLATAASARNSIDIIDGGMAKLADERAATALVVKRLNYILNDLSHQYINNSAYNSNIEDADIAKEVVNMTITQMVNQTTEAAQVQADISPQRAMQLVDVIRNSEQVEQYNAAFHNAN